MYKMEYSLWLTPDSQSGEQLNKTVIKLHQKFKTPLFTPHVTICGSFMNIENVMEFLKNSTFSTLEKPFYFASTDIGNTYFQCVYYSLVHDELLVTLNAKIESIEGRVGKRFHPHVSVVYGDLSDNQKSEAQEIASNDCPPLFIPGTLSIVPTGKDIEEWKPIFEIKLKQ